MKTQKFENDKSLISVEATTLRETDQAVLFDFGLPEEVWIPKSQLEEWPDEDDFGEVWIKEWIAKEKGII